MIGCGVVDAEPPAGDQLEQRGRGGAGDQPGHDRDVVNPEALHSDVGPAPTRTDEFGAGWSCEKANRFVLERCLGVAISVRDAIGESRRTAGWLAGGG